MQTALRAALVAATFAGCFSPKYPEGLQCGADDPQCPPGQTCGLDRVCRSMPVAGDAGPGDGPVGVDAEVVAPDAMLPDPWTDESNSAHGDLFGVWGRGPAETFAVGGTDTQGKLLRRDMALWNSDAAVAAGPRLTAISGATSTAWATSLGGTMYAYDGATWIKSVNLGSTTLNGVALPTDSIGMAVGVNGSAYAYTGTWGVGPATGVASDLTAVWGNAAGLFYAVGPAGLLLQTTTHATAWTRITLPVAVSQPDLRSVFHNSDATFVGSATKLIALTGPMTNTTYVLGCNALDGAAGIVWCASDGAVYRGSVAEGFSKDLDKPGVMFTAVHVVGNDVYVVGLGGAIWHRTRLN